MRTSNVIDHFFDEISGTRTKSVEQNIADVNIVDSIIELILDLIL